MSSLIVLVLIRVDPTFDDGVPPPKILGVNAFDTPDDEGGRIRWLLGVRIRQSIEEGTVELSQKLASNPEMEGNLRNR